MPIPISPQPNTSSRRAAREGPADTLAVAPAGGVRALRSRRRRPADGVADRRSAMGRGACALRAPSSAPAPSPCRPWRAAERVSASGRHRRIGPRAVAPGTGLTPILAARLRADRAADLDLRQPFHRRCFRHRIVRGSAQVPPDFMSTANHIERDAIVGPTFPLHIHDRISRLKPVDRRTAGILLPEYILLKVGKIIDYYFRVRGF